MTNMRLYRKQNGLTMKQLGVMVGASEASISMYETGKQSPDVYMLGRIADALHVTTDELLGRADEDDHVIPRTDEARALVHGIDRLPQHEREMALNVVKAMFSQYSDYFKEREKDAP